MRQELLGQANRAIALAPDITCERIGPKCQYLNTSRRPEQESARRRRIRDSLSIQITLPLLAAQG